MALVARLLQSLPLVIVLVILALVIYFVVSWARSPERAKEVLYSFDFLPFGHCVCVLRRQSASIGAYGFVPGGCGVGPCYHPCLPLALREEPPPLHG